MFVVIARPDYDCDGFSCGYHRVKLTSSEAAMLDEEVIQEGNIDTELIGALMEQDRAGFSDDPSACYLLTWWQFRDHVWRKLDGWHRRYWREVGYANSGLR